MKKKIVRKFFCRYIIAYFSFEIANIIYQIHFFDLNSTCQKRQYEPSPKISLKEKLPAYGSRQPNFPHFSSFLSTDMKKNLWHEIFCFISILHAKSMTKKHDTKSMTKRKSSRIGIETTKFSSFLFLYYSTTNIKKNKTII